MKLPGQQREQLFRGFQVCSALIMLHQLAGKAARDGYFLTYFGPSRLPEMVAAAAVVSLVASFAAGRLLSRTSPARMLPVVFLASGLAQLGEWLLLLRQPRVASVVIYLHMFALGALLFSGFWAMLSEEFDPREAKAKIGRITAAGTAGGLAGGVLAERLVAWFRADSLMLLLACAHLTCAAFLFWHLREHPEQGRAKSHARHEAAPAPPARDVRYLATLAALVLLGAVSASLIDFAFKFQATATFGKGPALVRFFALFYTGASLLTLMLQSLASRTLLEKVGLGRTMGTLPAAVVGGSALSILCPPGINVLGAVRAAESSIRGSLFRAGYEVCFTPLPAQEKRRMKPVIDVGAERLGDLAGSGIVKLVAQFASIRSSSWILSAACALGAGALVLARALDKAYVRALAASLLHRGAELDLDNSFDLTTRTVLSQSGLSGLPLARPMASRAKPSRDEVLLQLGLLRSQDAAVVRQALQSADPADPLVAAQTIRLLASPDLAAEAAAKLRPAAKRFLGLLCDCLRDPDQDVQVRRKIPGLLAGVPDQRAVDGLMAGLRDERFEVRCQCSRGLLRLKRGASHLRFDREDVFAAVDRELSAGKLLREGQSLGDFDLQLEDKDWLEEFLKERVHTGLEHVYTLLSLIYPEETMLVAFRALHVEDRHLHGTALEYLESVLPEKTRLLLFQVIGERPISEGQREAGEILDDLMKASATVYIRLKGPEDPLANS